IGAYIISVPVPKEHCQAKFTGAMKNMMGAYLPKETFDEKIKGILARGARKILPKFTPPIWSKSRLHLVGLDEGIFDLNLYLRPSLAVVDAKTGQKESEIYGEPCSPPLEKVVAGRDLVAVDSYCAGLLGVDWKRVKYLIYSDSVLGNADPERIRIRKI
ncbi:MAG: DUF362 domain-containing protein, partial [Candidatus Micrarchaeia archaeon]